MNRVAVVLGAAIASLSAAGGSSQEDPDIGPKLMREATVRAAIAAARTNEPQTIGRAESSGCIRMTNWDVVRLSRMLKPGFTAIFQA